MEGPPPPADRPLPGVRLGLPADGRGSLAGGGRRLLALSFDWACALVVSNAFFGENPWATLGVFAAVQVLGLTFGSASPGHRLFGLRVLRLVPGASVGAPVRTGGSGLVVALVRTALICLVVPPLVHDRDGRGLHDRAAGSVIVRT